jgi:hypothetical protein
MQTSFLTPWLLATAATFPGQARAAEPSYDVIVYGGTADGRDVISMGPKPLCPR